MFRDESEGVARKVRFQQVQTSRSPCRLRFTADGKARYPTAISSTVHTIPSSQPPIDPVVTLQTLSSSLDHQALCFFQCYYVVPFRDSPDNPQNCTRILHRLPFDNGATSASITAIGLAGLANVKKSLEIMTLARAKYVSALRLTNAALQNILGAKSDMTLRAIVLLSMYEVSSVVQLCATV